MKITARGLWALVNINLFLFILSFSHSLPRHKKETLFIAHSYSFFTQHGRITIIYSSEKASCSVATERGLNETKAAFNVSCMLHWISICRWAERDNKTCDWEQRKDGKRRMESHFPGYTTLHNGSVPYARSSCPPATSWECFSLLYIREKQLAHSGTHSFRTHRCVDAGRMWITALFSNYPSCLALRAGAVSV